MCACTSVRGLAALTRVAMADSSDCAAATPTPCRRRPITFRNDAPRWSAHWAENREARIGIQICVGSSASNGNSKAAGMIPTMVIGSPSRSAVFPTMAGSRSKWRAHRPSEITAARWAPCGRRRGEHPAGNRRYPEQREQVRRYDGHGDRCRLTMSCQRHGRGRVRGQPFNRLGLRAPVEDVEIGAVVGLVAHGRVDSDQTSGVGERQRFEQYAVDDAEDCGVGADAERQHDHKQRAEARRLEKEANCLAKVSEHEGPRLRAQGSNDGRSRSSQP